MRSPRTPLGFVAGTWVVSISLPYYYHSRFDEGALGIVDSQSVKTTGVGGEGRGYDSGKKVKGRKRHLSNNYDKT